MKIFTFFVCVILSIWLDNFIFSLSDYMNYSFQGFIELVIQVTSISFYMILHGINLGIDEDLDPKQEYQKHIINED